MQDNKLTLLVDMGWLTMRYFSVMLKGFDKSLPDETRQETADEMLHAMSKGISNMLNKFNCIDNIILMTEGGSWRKQIPIPKFLEGETYKGNRKRPIEFDWDRIWATAKKLTDNAKELGITVSTGYNIEGDDWAWYWSRKLNDNYINTIIWTSDNDLKQLIDYNEKTCTWTCWYNDKNGLYLPSVLNETEQSIIDFFTNIQPVDPILDSLKSKTKEINYIDPDSIIIDKIIRGDSGDNIKPAIKYKKGKKEYRLSKKEWETEAKKLNIYSPKSLIDNIDKISEDFSQIKKYNMSKNDIEQMLKYNTKLVFLDESQIPSSIIINMDNCIYKNAPIKDLRINSELLEGNNKDVEDLLKQYADIIAEEKEIEDFDINNLKF